MCKAWHRGSGSVCIKKKKFIKLQNKWWQVNMALQWDKRELFTLLISSHCFWLTLGKSVHLVSHLWSRNCGISVIHCLFIPGMSSIAMVHFNSQLGVWKPDRCSPCVWYWSCPNKPCWSQQLHPSTVTLGSLPTCLPEFRVYQALTCIFFKCPHLVRDSYVGISSADNEWFCAFIVERLFFCNL